MIRFQFLCLSLFLSVAGQFPTFSQNNLKPDELTFVRQSAKRFIFDADHRLPLASLNPSEVVGFSAMHPIRHTSDSPVKVVNETNHLSISSASVGEAAIWFGGFNPFATYTIRLASCEGDGAIGFEFSDYQQNEQFRVTVSYKDGTIVDVRQKILSQGNIIANESIVTELPPRSLKKGDRLILQMLGSGLTLYLGNEQLPLPIAQSDYADKMDLRKQSCIQSFQSNLWFESNSKATVHIENVSAAFTSGMGLADIRAMTYEDGSPLLDQGRVWYTMTIRGRALPHHIQGVFSMDPTLFDLRLEGVIVFDRQDGILRNEVASHIYYDRKEKLWRGITTGFSAYAKPHEKKELLAVESSRDPRFGFSVMNASSFGVVGDIEDPHILFDKEAGKWRILTCENTNKEGYKAIMLESDTWNQGYRRIAGPVPHNSTGTSIQRINGKLYCFSGSQERKIFIYSYPDLKNIGTLKMDLPPWDETAGTRVWPNVVELPEGYPFRYVALMMDRYNYPGVKGPNWTYGALYLYHGYAGGHD